jgi:uncharacterized protein YejL (UPF0352 family)
MTEIEINGERFRVNKMNVFDQAHVARKVAPIIFSMGRGYAAALSKLPQRPETSAPPDYANGGNGSTDDFEAPPDAQEVAQQNEVLFDTLVPIADVLSKMEDADVDYVLKKCLAVCQKHNGSNWVPIMRGGNLMFEDLDLAALIQLTMEVVQDNLGPSLRGLLGQNSGAAEDRQSTTLQ